MKTKMIAVAAVVALAGAGFAFWPEAEEAATTAAASSTGEMVAVSMPALSGEASVGQNVFAARCAACHGPNAGGIDGAGPPLVHVYYEPNHHADFAFYMAAERGVRAHHWTFGDMPPVENISRAEIAAVVAFIRKVQQENGIF